MEIVVRITENFGDKVVYPVCEKAKLFAKIAKTKTLTTETLFEMRSLGYKIKEINNG